MSYGAGPTDDDDVSSVLTEDERFRLREVITHDVQIKKFLQASENKIGIGPVSWPQLFEASFGDYMFNKGLIVL